MKILGFKYDENNKHHRFAKNVVLTVTSLSLFVAAWWVIAIVTDLPVIPTPAETWDSLVYLYLYGDPITEYSLWHYVSMSLTTFFKGFLPALLVAVPVGLLLGYSKILNSLSTPVLEVLRPIAPIAWAPILVSGVGSAMGSALVVFIGIFFPLLTNIIFGVQKIDSNLIDASKTLGATQGQIFFKVMIPSATPYIMNGIKVGLGIGWMCIVAAELYAVEASGIGFYLGEQASLSNWSNAFAAIVVIAILGLLTTGVADYLHRTITKRMGMS